MSSRTSSHVHPPLVELDLLAMLKTRPTVSASWPVTDQQQQRVASWAVVVGVTLPISPLALEARSRSSAWSDESRCLRAADASRSI